MTPRAKSALVLVGVFALGGVSGAAAMRAYGIEQFRPAAGESAFEARARLRMEAMRRRLDLTSDQVSKIEVILADAEKQRDEKVEPCKGELDEVREAADARILEVLDEGQRQKYREYREHKRKGRGKRD